MGKKHENTFHLRRYTDDKCMKNCLTSLAIRKCKQKPQWDDATHLSEWPEWKTVTTVNAGKDAEKLDHS